MKILHILEATQGGTRRHVLDLLPALVRQGFDCDLIYSPLRYPAFARDAVKLEKQGVCCWAIPMARGFGGGRDAQAIGVLRAHLQAHTYDVVHCHSTKAGFLGRLAAPWKTPVVYTPHCIAFDTSLPRLQRRAARLIEKLLAHRTAHFIAVARHEARVIRSVGLCSPQKLSVIYNGINLEEFDEIQNSKFKIQNSQLTIGCFGRLTRQKNQAALLRALPVVRRVVPQAQLLLVGSGEDEANLRALADHWNIKEAVTFAGEIEEARPYYARCDIVAQPSRWEGCPYSILEAMAAKCPVVATSVGGVPEVLQAPGGVVYSAAGPETLAEHLIALAHDETGRIRMGEAARARIESHFTATQMVEQTMQVYDRL
jgi:glycosyltransferase involved in cell wall biosynthesis